MGSRRKLSKRCPAEVSAGSAFVVMLFGGGRAGDLAGGVLRDDRWALALVWPKVCRLGWYRTGGHRNDVRLVWSRSSS